MRIIEVQSIRDKREFINAPKWLYRSDANWICPPDDMIEGIFGTETNEFLRHGEVCRWILEDRGQTIGRIAAFYDKNKAFTFAQPTGGCGYFECINSQLAANMLFEMASNWLKSKNMQAMDGPINFGRNKRFWGLLVDGFEKQAFGMNYNPPYYRSLYENYGFRLFFEQFSYHLYLDRKFPERYWRIAQWVINKGEYSFKQFNYKQRALFIPDLVKIYNEAWGAYKKDLTPMTVPDFEKILDEIKPVLQEEFIWISYHRRKPIAFLLMFPDYNQILQHFRGRVHWWQWPKFLYIKTFKRIDRARVPVLGLLPDYEQLGIEAALFRHIKETMKDKPQYKIVELSWIGDFEPQIKKIYEFFGAEISRRHITYRYMFDKAAEYKRYPIPVVE